MCADATLTSWTQRVSHVALPGPISYALAHVPAQLHESMNMVRDLQDEIREHDEAQAKMTRSTRTWLLYFTFIEAAVLFGVTAWQNLCAVAACLRVPWARARRVRILTAADADHHASPFARQISSPSSKSRGSCELILRRSGPSDRGEGVKHPQATPQSFAVRLARPAASDPPCGSTISMRM